MKQTRLLRTLLVALCLLTGTTSLWAATVWKTYKTWDFVTGYAAADVSGLLPSGSWTTSGSGTSATATTSANISSATAVTTNTSSRYYGLLFQGESGKLQFASNGVVLGGGATVVTIPNLKTGQRVTITIDNANGVETHSSSVATLTGVTTSQSGDYYQTVGIVGTSGDLAIKRVNTTTFRIRSILVETPIVNAVYTQDFTGVTEKPSDWTINAGTITFNNNMTISHPSSGTNARNGYLNLLSSASSLTGDNWSITFKTSIKPGNNNTGQEIAVWGTNSTANNQKVTSISGVSVGYHLADNAFFQAYNSQANSTSYKVVVAGTDMGTITLESGKEYIFTVHCTDIDAPNNTANLQAIIIKAGTGAEIFNKTQAINTTITGTFGGIFYHNARYSAVTSFDDIYLSQANFTLSETAKEVDVNASETVDITNIQGDNIRVTSSNESIATASYANGTITINGIANGVATITVYCMNNGITTSKTIEVTVGTVGTTTVTVNYKYGGTKIAESTTVENVTIGSTLTISDVTYESLIYGTDCRYVSPVFNGGNSYTVVADGEVDITYTRQAAVTNVKKILKAGSKEKSNTNVAQTNKYVGDVIYLPYPYYINYEGTLYNKANQGTGNYYSHPFTLTENNQECVITYSVTDKTNVVYFSEGEEIEGATATNAGNNMVGRSSNQQCGYADSDITLINLPAGSYKATVVLYANSSAGTTLKFQFGDEAWNAVRKSQADGEGATNSSSYTHEFTLASAADVKWLTSGNSKDGLDYIFIQKTAETATITAAGAATLVSDYALDFSNVNGLEAYIATAQDGANVTFDKVTGAVPAGTPLYLRGTTADVPVVASADPVGTNLLVAGTGAAVASEADGKYNFILNKVDDVLGFYWAAGNTVATNRAYLSLSADPFAGGGAKGVNMIFNGETTGIYSVGAQSKEANVKGIYNLQGQRVYNPTKGLYIIDGKKYVIN